MAQSLDSLKADSSVRIINFNPDFVLNVDSVNVYQFTINREPGQYYWYLKNAPVGLMINKDDGKLTFKAAKNYFLSGKLKYDNPYQVGLGLQSLNNPMDKIDTSFTISFYNTEILPTKLKPSISGPLIVEEGETISFRVQCETGSFPFETIFFISTVPIEGYSLVKQCNDEFRWMPGYDFVKDNDPNKERTVVLSFIGTTRFQARDTVAVKVTVKNALNYPKAKEEYELVVQNLRQYILQLKYAFLQLDQKVKKTKSSFQHSGIRSLEFT